MRVKMRPRYRGGTRLSKREFVDQPWLCGMLTLRTIEGRSQLGLWEARPDDVPPPLGVLWRPEVVACAFNTISFPGQHRSIGGGAIRSGIGRCTACRNASMQLRKNAM